jgi:hypothetical protein
MVYHLRKCFFFSHEKLDSRGEFIFYYEEIAQHGWRKRRMLLER